MNINEGQSLMMSRKTALIDLFAEGGNQCYFSKFNTTVHLEFFPSATLGSRIRVKVEANISKEDVKTKMTTLKSYRLQL